MNPGQASLDFNGFQRGLVDLGFAELEPATLAGLMEEVSPGAAVLRGGTLNWSELEAYCNRNNNSSSSSSSSNNNSKAGHHQGDLESQLRAVLANVPDLPQAFRDADLDGSGAVSASELAAVFEKLTGSPLAATMAQAIVDSFDVNGDGQLDEKEFVRLLLPRFLLYVMTPAGQIFMAVDPNTTLAQGSGWFIIFKFAFGGARTTYMLYILI